MLDKYFDDKGWCSFAKKIESPNYNNRPSGERGEVSLLVIHCISLPEGSYDNDNVETFFLNQLDYTQDERFQSLRTLKVSSHFYIKRNGEIIQFVSTDKRAWHAGVSTYKGRENCNDFSIGIELQGTDHSDFSEDQYKSLADVTNALLLRYPKIKGNIQGHQDIAPERKKDPGKLFDWNCYLTMIQSN